MGDEKIFSKEELWQAALGEIELNISKANFLTWLKNTSIDSIKEGVVVISVPNHFSKEWLENKYHKFIFQALKKLISEINKIDYIINANAENKNTAAPEKEKTKKINETALLKEQLSLAEIEINPETNLNQRYMFDTFIVGSSNELAHAAALSVAKNPGQTYNPLFIYGGVGLGKTHLLQAIGNEAQKKEKLRVKYVTSEKFTEEVVTAIQNHTMNQLKNNYRKTDILIVDDIQFLVGREKTQEEFFHLFNTLYEKNKQIILSSDRPPKSIATLEDRLRSRFSGGMIADIGYPDFETRLAILKTKVAAHNFKINENILIYIANAITQNIREIEGCLTRLIAFTRLTKKEPTEEEAIRILNEVIKTPKKIFNIKQIIKTVANFYDIEEKDLIAKNRQKEIVKPRQVAMYLLREDLKSSFPYIGKKFGNRDHTTVIYACEKINDLIKTNETIKQEIGIIRERLNN
ncbi:MAG: chromosomal replication initiator protein DnaA [Parcubacteria group bacterium]|nr:chromosomal replication initiator protein DnaA [Parcubacteria group bacterium]